MRFVGSALMCAAALALTGCGGDPADSKVRGGASPDVGLHVRVVDGTRCVIATRAKTGVAIDCEEKP